MRLVVPLVPRALCPDSVTETVFTGESKSTQCTVGRVRVEGLGPSRREGNGRFFLLVFVKHKRTLPIVTHKCRVVPHHRGSVGDSGTPGSRG